MAKWIQDPGHGGTQPGAVANGQQEKEWTLEAALYVDKRLGELGVNSVMTRSTDKTLTSVPRTDIVKSSGAKYCLSHHFNAGGGKGAETIHSIFSNGKLAKAIADEIAKAGMPTRRVFSRKGSSGSDYYFMHRLTGSVETVIIEYGFLDSSDYNKLKDKNLRIKLYEAVIKAVCEWEGVKYVSPKSSSTSSETKKVLDKIQVVTGALWTYNSKDWDDKYKTYKNGTKLDASGSKIKVGGGYMYKLSNGKYITANTKYVKPIYKTVEIEKPKPAKKDDGLYKVQVFAGSKEGAEEILEKLEDAGFGGFMYKA
ncbi:N-acetylmuramoyl-L-alanine amidase [Virgibacillus dakarensis]|nr:N-acetylmuramoyl-L-alanine amidase [Virgibacillus dakarensis]